MHTRMGCSEYPVSSVIHWEGRVSSVWIGNVHTNVERKETEKGRETYLCVDSTATATLQLEGWNMVFSLHG